MKLSETTLKILHNYSSINDGIVIRKTVDGQSSKVRTKDTTGVIYSESEVVETFADDICLYNLGKFISAYNQMKNPDLILERDFIKLKSGNTTLKFAYASPEVIIHPTKDFIPPEPDSKFVIVESDFGKLLKVSSTLNLPDIKISSNDEGDIFMTAYNRKIGGNTFDVKVGSGHVDGDINLQASLLNFIPGDYEGHIIGQEKVIFYNTTFKTDDKEHNLTYMVGTVED